MIPRFFEILLDHGIIATEPTDAREAAIASGIVVVSVGPPARSCRPADGSYQRGLLMTRKMMVLTVAAMTAGATGYAEWAQQPQAYSPWEGFKPGKAAKKWQYCILTKYKTDDKGSVGLIFEGASLSAACSGGGVEVA